MVWDGWIVSADGSAYQIERRDAAGVVRSRIVVDRPRVAVTDDMRAAARSLAPGVPPVVFADSLPVLRSLQVDAEGLLWVSDYHLGSDSTWSATAFREDGAIVGRIGGSGNVRRPESFSRGWVWTRESDGPNTPWFGRWRVVARSVE